MDKERRVGTVSRGIRLPIIRQGDNLAEIVADSVLAAAESEGFEMRDRDVIAITESIVARSQGNYASVKDIADDVRAKFPAMYNSFCYGAPPHAGVAPGVDRMVMLLAGVDTIREVIPFPMNKNAQDLMMDAPSAVTQAQLDELHICVTAEEA